MSNNQISGGNYNGDDEITVGCSVADVKDGIATNIIYSMLYSYSIFL